MWSGAKSIELGLVDGYGTVDSVARDVIKASEVRDFSVRQNFAEKFAKQFGTQVGAGLSAALTGLTLR
jgi:protease-4